MRTCRTCSYFKKGRCRRFSAPIKKFISVDDCKFYTTEPLKSDLRKRQNKNNKPKVFTIYQLNPKKEKICKFVEVEWIETEFVKGRIKKLGKRNSRGLLVNNRVYLTNGKYKLADGISLRFTKVYDNIPDWATYKLKKKFEDFDISEEHLELYEEDINSAEIE